MVSAALLLLVPGIMAKENWDDHDRSGRYTTRDFAFNYLASCEPNAIIFTNGDNDTFPLWYAQEVEGVGRDIRVCNLSYLAADWYIDQMRRAAYDSKPLPFSLKPHQYMTGTREQLIVADLERFKNQYLELKLVMDFVGDDSPNSMGVPFREGFLTWNELDNEYRKPQYADYLYNFIPSKNLKITVDKEKVLATGTVPLKDSALIVPAIRWTVKEEVIYKNSMMVLDLLANNNWERPVYFAITVGPENHQNLSEYFQKDGLANRFVPLRRSETGGIDADKLYDKMMNQFRWGNIQDPKVYLCETNTRLLSHFRTIFAQLADALIMENKNDSAIMALDRAYEVIPTYQLPLDRADVLLLESYYRAGAKEKGSALAEAIFQVASEEMDYFLSFPKRFSNGIRNETQYRKATLYHLCYITWQSDRDLFETFRMHWDTLFPNERWDRMLHEEEE